MKIVAKPKKDFRDGDYWLQLFDMNEEYLVITSH